MRMELVELDWDYQFGSVFRKNYDCNSHGLVVELKSSILIMLYFVPMRSSGLKARESPSRPRLGYWQQQSLEEIAMVLVYQLPTPAAARGVGIKRNTRPHEQTLRSVYGKMLRVHRSNSCQPVKL
jgi:hypothetical protein